MSINDLTDINTNPDIFPSTNDNNDNINQTQYFNDDQNNFSNDFLDNNNNNDLNIDNIETYDFNNNNKKYTSKTFENKSYKFSNSNILNFTFGNNDTDAYDSLLKNNSNDNNFNLHNSYKEKNSYNDFDINETMSKEIQDSNINYNTNLSNNQNDYISNSNSNGNDIYNNYQNNNNFEENYSFGKDIYNNENNMENNNYEDYTSNQNNNGYDGYNYEANTNYQNNNGYDSYNYKDYTNNQNNNGNYGNYKNDIYNNQNNNINFDNYENDQNNNVYDSYHYGSKIYNYQINNKYVNYNSNSNKYDYQRNNTNESYVNSNSIYYNQDSNLNENNNHININTINNNNSYENDININDNKNDKISNLNDTKFNIINSINGNKKNKNVDTKINHIKANSNIYKTHIEPNIKNLNIHSNMSKSFDKTKNNNLYKSTPLFNKENTIGTIHKHNTISTENNNIMEQKNIPIQSSTNDVNSNDNPAQTQVNPNIYYFHLKGLNNIGSTCYMNATLQCLLHVSELISYFLNEYPNDFKKLNEKNKNVPSHGNISKAFYELVKGVYSENKNINNTLNAKTSITSEKNDNNNLKSFSPEKFHEVLGTYNSQFKNLEANDSKDLILYLLQTIHSEINYLSDTKITSQLPDQYDRTNSFNFFIRTYDFQNLSIISRIFYGTFESMTKCLNCSKILYNFQKFEFISFGVSKYVGKDFNIYNGFEDNQQVQLLKGDNKFYCNICKKLCDAEICSKIILPPNKLLINIDYGKNKIFQPKSVKFDEEIDITKYVNFDYGMEIKYKIIGVCCHYGSSGQSGHYVAFCKNRENGQWYNFNDSSCIKCDKNMIYRGTPYLLLYEKIS